MDSMNSEDNEVDYEGDDDNDVLRNNNNINITSGAVSSSSNTNYNNKTNNSTWQGQPQQEHAQQPFPVYAATADGPPKKKANPNITCPIPNITP